MFSFPDARKAHNQLRWIGKTQKMVGTSGNSFMALTAYRWKETVGDRQTDRQADRQTDRQTDKQTDKQTRSKPHCSV